MRWEVIDRRSGQLLGEESRPMVGSGAYLRDLAPDPLLEVKFFLLVFDDKNVLKFEHF